MSTLSAQPDERNDDRRRLRLLIDIALGIGLVLALFAVWLIDSCREADNRELPRSARVVEGERAAAAPLRLAVTLPEFDDMGSLLDSLGHGYRHQTAAYNDFLKPDALKAYDVVFLTCGGVPTEWLSERLRDSDRGSAGVYRAKPETVDGLYDNIRSFVRDGGTLYVSDLHFDVLLIAFPEFIDDAAVGRGAVQTVTAQVVDAGLRKHLGDEIPLRFDMRAWRPAAFRHDRVTTYLEGDYELVEGDVVHGPLMVSFSYGEGTVIFTSFHNEAQNSDLEKLLLRYLVFTTVTAREQTDVRQVMIQGGFSPQQRNLLSLSAVEEPVSDSYEHAARGPLQFVLGFANRGAELKLAVVSPDGERYEKRGTATYSIDVEDAAPGRWQVLITPIVVPYRNFPFTLTIGDKISD